MPSDLDILVPSTSTNPLWTQVRAKRRPSATAWARSFSWCGKARSCPPPCRSKSSPSRSSAITTHSVCQPGRPSPHGDGQLGSPGLAFFHSAKSTGERFSSLPSTAGAGLQRVERLAGEQPVVVDRLGQEVDAVGRLVGRAAVDQSADEGDHVLDVGGGVGILVGPAHVQRVHGPVPDGLAALGDVAPVAVLVLGPLDDLVVDVGDVRHVRDVEAGPRQVAAQDVEDEGEPAVAQVGRAVDGGPADVHRHLARLTELDGGHGPLGGVEQLQHGWSGYFCPPRPCTCSAGRVVDPSHMPSVVPVVAGRQALLWDRRTAARRSSAGRRGVAATGCGRNCPN